LLNIRQKISLLALLCVFGLAHGSAITFKAVSVGVDDDMVLLDIAEQYELSDNMLEALENGVPLTFVTYINMRRQRNLMWDENMVELEVKNVLRYHPLSSQYRVDHLYTNTQQEFATRDAALRALGEIRDLPLIQEQRLEPGKFYLIDVQTAHKIDALPLPLRPRAYVSPGWHLSSKVWEWQLKP
jgi:hypothetical protein